MKKVLLVCFVLALAFSTQLWAYTPYGYGYQELDRAKSYMDRGDYRYALDMFYSITQRTSYDRSIRKEAAYYRGFCLVKLNDPWGAIRAYESFLDRYAGSYSDSFLVPDALYVLGRTYEEVYNNDRARYYYRKCIDRFPYNEFAGKSRDRLHIIGGGWGYPNYSVSMSMEEAAPASKTAKKGAAKAQTEKNDPYLAFQLDKSRIDRVNKLIKSIEKMDRVDEAIQSLNADDRSLETVKQALEMYSSKKKFENLHQK